MPRLKAKKPAVAVAICAFFAAASVTVIHFLNRWIFTGWGGWMDWTYLVGIVVLVTAAIHLVIRLSRPPVPSDGDETFQRRLPLALRGKLVRVEAQDHYLGVVTRKGSALILMRLGDALRELPAQGGLQVHR